MSLPIRIKLPEDFLRIEIRSGYEVSEKLKKIWAVELDLLSEFDRVCRKHNIKYQAFAGTLLGVVRHKGFIPWDDDLDVAMDRENYNRLCKIAADEFSEPYFFQTALTNRQRFLPFARLRNSLTTGMVTGDAVEGYNNGIYIDIHPLDGKPDSKLLQKSHRFLCKIVRKFCTTYNFVGSSNVKSKVWARILFPIVRVIPFKIWYWLHERVFSAFKNVRTLGMLTHFSFGDRYEIDREDLLDSIEQEYEMLKIPIPRKFDKVLARIYGDYMSFPPAEMRGKWHEGSICFEPDIPYKEYLSRKCDTE